MIYMLPEGLTELERRMFAHYLASEQQDDVRAVIADQLACAQAGPIDSTGVGFYREFTFAPEAVVAHVLPNNMIDLCFGEHPDLIGGAFFMLMPKNGVVFYLEAITCANDWPLDEGLFTFG
jgi:hypothetical protein